MRFLVDLWEGIAFYNTPWYYEISIRMSSRKKVCVTGNCPCYMQLN